MTIIDRKNTLKGIMVREAMRRLVAAVPRDASIETATRYAVKYKVNAVLVTGEGQEGVGVVSKTDLMGAYYAGLPLETPLEGIMVGPPVFCHVEESLEAALEIMRENRIHRLYVTEETPNKAVGILAYPDIVGILYRYCRQCKRSIVGSRASESDFDYSDRFLVNEVMRDSVQFHDEEETILQIMEGLSSHQLGAVLIKSRRGFPVGVVSKTDLIVAYRHRIPPDATAKAVMSSPVQLCGYREPLHLAVQRMIFSDVHRLFVQKASPNDVVGVLSLSDAARVRSGSCRACASSRISPHS